MKYSFLLKVFLVILCTQNLAVADDPKTPVIKQSDDIVVLQLNHPITLAINKVISEEYFTHLG